MITTDRLSSPHFYTSKPAVFSEKDPAVFLSGNEAVAYAQQVWQQDQRSVSVLYNSKGYFTVVGLTESLEYTENNRYQLVVAYI